MFDLLSQLITKANLSGMTLMVRPTGLGRLSVTICTESTHWTAEDPILKAALAQPLNIEGELMEIETKIRDNLSQYSQSFVRASISSNADSVCAKTDQAVINKEKESTNTEPVSESVPTTNYDIGEQVTDPDLF